MLLLHPQAEPYVDAGAAGMCPADGPSADVCPRELSTVMYCADRWFALTLFAVGMVKLRHEDDVPLVQCRVTP